MSPPCILSLELLVSDLANRLRYSLTMDSIINIERFRLFAFHPNPIYPLRLLEMHLNVIENVTIRLSDLENGGRFKLILDLVASPRQPKRQIVFVFCPDCKLYLYQVLLK